MVGAGRGPFMGMRGYMKTTCVHMYVYIYIHTEVYQHSIWGVQG